MFQCRRQELAIRESSCSKHYLVVLLCSYEANHPLQHCFRSSVPSLCIPWLAIFPLSRTHFDRKNILASQYHEILRNNYKFLDIIQSLISHNKIINLNARKIILIGINQISDVQKNRSNILINRMIRIDWHKIWYILDCLYPSNLWLSETDYDPQNITNTMKITNVWLKPK